MTFKDIIGQEHIVRHMTNAIREQKVSHAYIIAGEKGCGKKLLAGTYAAALECERGGVEPCGECQSCKQLMGGNHPDVRFITHEKPNVISVDEIRVQLNSDVSIKPYARPKKIYIIDEAEKMNTQAQNAMLKTIEEPPEYAIIMLLVSNESLLLPTIRSRCIQLSVRPVDKQLISAYLMDKCGVSSYMAGIASDFSDGNIGKAIEFAVSEEFSELKNSLISKVTSIDSADAGKLYNMATEWGADKTTLFEKLSLLEMWYRDVLVVKSTDKTKSVCFSEEASQLYKQASEYTYNELISKIDSIRCTRERLQANVNADASLMLMFLSLRDRNGR